MPHCKSNINSVNNTKSNNNNNHNHKNNNNNNSVVEVRKDSSFLGVSNNYYEDCPALMSDGRFITNYLPNCEMNNNVARLYSGKPLTSWEYTYYLTNEAGKANNYFLNKYNEEYGCKAYPYKIIEPNVFTDGNFKYSHTILL